MSSLLEGGDQNQPQLPELPQFSTTLVGSPNVDINVSSFADRDLVVVTSSKKLGSLISVDVMTSPSANRPSTFNIKVLFGMDDERTTVFARSVAQVIDDLRKRRSQQRVAPGGTCKPILCCVALKEAEFHLSRKIVEVLKTECDLWN